jgi:peptidase E
MSDNHYYVNRRKIQETLNKTEEIADFVITNNYILVNLKNGERIVISSKEEAGLRFDIFKSEA